MALAQVQQAQALLYTGAKAREAFFADPMTIGEAWGLARLEIEQLSRAAAQIQFFALSLQRKRLNEVNRLLPLTRRALGARFGALFMGYAATCVPHGTRKHQDDALAFANFLARQVRMDVEGEAWIGEMARYEAGWIEAADPGRRWLVRGFWYDVGKLARSGRHDEPVAPRPRQLTLAAWYRLSARGRVRHFLVALPAVKLGPRR